MVYNTAAWLLRAPHVALLVLKMTLPSAGSSSSIFEGGRLKPGIYKIQNLSTEGHVDIHEQSKEVCCRPTKDIKEGGGLVRLYPLPVARV